jgi:uncharacterized protein (DUF2141 family)
MVQMATHRVVNLTRRDNRAVEIAAPGKMTQIRGFFATEAKGTGKQAGGGRHAREFAHSSQTLRLLVRRMQKPLQRWAVVFGVLGSLLSAMLLATPADAADLRLTITGIRSDVGEILIALYDNAAGFNTAIANAGTRGLMPDGGRLIGTAIRAKRGSQSTVFTQLAPGRYAVVVIHDENDNGRLDKNALGMPTEGYGFGNNARGLLSAPSFNAASITIGTAGVSTSITLRYAGAPVAEDNSNNDRLTGSGSSQARPHR